MGTTRDWAKYREYQAQYRKNHKDYFKSYYREWVKTHKEETQKRWNRWKKNNPLKIDAQRKLQWAIESGKIKRLPCEVCGDAKSHAHHEDYAKPYDVKWLCHEHHFERHRKL